MSIFKIIWMYVLQRCSWSRDREGKSGVYVPWKEVTTMNTTKRWWTYQKRLNMGPLTTFMAEVYINIIANKTTWPVRNVSEMSDWHLVSSRLFMKFSSIFSILILTSSQKNVFVRGSRSKKSKWRHHQTDTTRQKDVKNDGAAHRSTLGQTWMTVAMWSGGAKTARYWQGRKLDPCTLLLPKNCGNVTHYND